jgi:hypothetical protein
LSAHGAFVPPPLGGGGAGVLVAQGARVGWSGPLGTAGPAAGRAVKVAHGAAVEPVIGSRSGRCIRAAVDGAAFGLGDEYAEVEDVADGTVED